MGDESTKRGRGLRMKIMVMKRNEMLSACRRKGDTKAGKWKEKEL